MWQFNFLLKTMVEYKIGNLGGKLFSRSKAVDHWSLLWGCIRCKHVLEMVCRGFKKTFWRPENLETVELEEFLKGDVKHVNLQKKKIAAFWGWEGVDCWFLLHDNIAHLLYGKCRKHAGMGRFLFFFSLWNTILLKIWWISGLGNTLMTDALNLYAYKKIL